MKYKHTSEISHYVGILVLNYVTLQILMSVVTIQTTALNIVTTLLVVTHATVMMDTL